MDSAASSSDRGTPTEPYHSLARALCGSAAREGIQIKIKGGSYPESVTFSNKMQVLSWDGNAVTIGQ